MVNLLCGPIVGQVTKTTACVLLEVDEDSPGMGCILQVTAPGDKKHVELKGHRSDHCVKKDMVARQPRVYKFENLQPNVCYRILVPEVRKDHAFGEVRTMPTDIKSCNIAVVSCDKRTYKPASTNMWETMWQRMQSKKDNIHVLLHIGDNVYMDGDVSHNMSNERVVADDEGVFDPDNTDQSIPYVQARKVLLNTPKEEWPDKRDEILEIYRQEYRATFGRKYVALVLANVSNLMILDDHDIRDDFGSVPEDANPETAEYFLGHLALRAFHEYQRALWDPDIVERGTDDLTSEFLAINYGPVGIMMLDSRTVWSLYKSKRADNDLSYFGEEQMNEVKTRLTEKDDVVMWIMVCPLPLLFLKKKLNEMVAGVCERADDLMGFINVQHQKDLEGIFDLIQQWRKVKAGRELLVFSGDVHIAGFTDVYHNPPNGGEKQLVCRQITSSAINNERPGMVGMAATRMMLDFSESYGDYTYKHYDWINKCNYAVLSVEKFAPKLVYKLKLVHEEGLILKKSGDKQWDMNSANSCVCQVL